MSKASSKVAPAVSSSQSWLHQHGTEIQKFGTIRLFPIALSHDARLYACQRLNRILADS
jgi:starvation-inducible DNA-binding protein